MVDYTKRKTLRALGALGAASTLGMQGCSVIDICRRRFHPDDFSQICRQGIQPIFDAHGHFFNATDMQAGRYLTGPVLMDLSSLSSHSAVRRFLEKLGWLIQKFAQIVAPSARDELDFLKHKRFQDQIKHPTDQQYSMAEDPEYLTASEAFFDQLSQTEKSEINLLYKAAQQEEIRTVSSKLGINLSQEKSTANFTANTLSQAISGTLPIATSQRRLQSRGLNTNTSDFIIERYLAFVLRMLVRRSKNLAEYKDTYSMSEKGPSVVSVMDVTVDFDFWLGCTEGNSSMADQVVLHERLHELTDGYTVPILGVNPVKMLIQGDDYGHFIENTLKRGIYRGVKLYPTLGYSPSGALSPDVQQHFDTCGHLSSLPVEAQIKGALEDIYSLCIKYDAVVMAHSNRSKGISSIAATLAGPAYWRQVLQQERFKQLKVNFGHMGDLVDLGSPNCWPCEFLNLMAKYDNVYGDVGYWFEKQDKNTAAQLITLMKKAGDKTFNKVMYGTDWLMISQEIGWNNYLSWTYNTFTAFKESGVINDEQMQNLFYQNGQSLLGNAVKACQ